MPRLQNRLTDRALRQLLGHYGGEAGMSLAEARSAREQAQRQLRDKIDPADKKSAVTWMRGIASTQSWLATCAEQYAACP